MAAGDGEGVGDVDGDGAGDGDAVGAGDIAPGGGDASDVAEAVGMPVAVVSWGVALVVATGVAVWVTFSWPASVQADAARRANSSSPRQK